MTVRILLGDVRAKLAELPDESVHCVVTSPPYFGLRDYGTASWEGGDPACDHLGPPMRTNAQPTNGSASFHGGTTRANEPMGKSCNKCGATRTDKQIGLEPTPAEFVAVMVEVFREVRRVLRKDGTLWLNLGDNYASSSAGAAYGWTNGKTSERDKETIGAYAHRSGDLPPKNLLGIPWRVAFALQADGWYLRSEIIWHKLNPMPESVTDRPTKSHETIFLLSKNARYYYDADAVAETTEAGNGREIPQGRKGSGNSPAPPEITAAPRIPKGLPAIREREGGQSSGEQSREGQNGSLFCEPQGTRSDSPEAHSPTSAGIEYRDCFNGSGLGRDQGDASTQVRILPSGRSAIDAGSCDTDQQGRPSHEGQRGSGVQAMQQPQEGPRAKRNLRDVWSIATQPFKEAHFATFPPDLIEPCIKAGCPKDCCAKCGAPVVRHTETTYTNPGNRTTNGPRSTERRHETAGFAVRLEKQTETTGWSPSCSCDAGLVRGVCLDPFGGAGTTGLVADRLQRDAILIELNPAYAAMMTERIADDGPLFATITA